MLGALLAKIYYSPARKFRFFNRTSLYLFLVASVRAARLK
jgi:hypothetical protein